ncbi:LysR family transcriptional regulator [Caulobacter sp. SLTY]|uniref:LysR family transcriptional regulator n=1 Tax=Caulobacter sp. SLTY TaxID=2683262 RepID=UPI001412DE9D|nr:LysR substrate-binding domain-containing protein [Caulobacter sp. SLTY]NBB15888.1 LysR family transcriptional regulator [Caulobacter sp. SLTY]
MNRLDPKSLEAFRAVIETGSATLAADRLGMTQPAVTKAIATLETRTGLTLFERGRFGMRPTAEGALLDEEVRRSFSGLDRIAIAAEAIRQGMRGQLSIATLPVYAEGLVGRAVAALSLEAPELNLRILAVDQDETYRRVGLETVDLGVVMGPLSPAAQLANHPLGRRRMMAVMRVDHPLANRSEVGVADLVDTELVMLSPPNPYRDALIHAFAREAAVIRSRLEVLTQRGAALMAVNARSVAVIDQEMAEEMAYNDPMVHAAAFTAVPPWDVSIVHRRDRPLSLAAEAVMHRLKLASTDFQAAA